MVAVCIFISTFVRNMTLELIISAGPVLKSETLVTDFNYSLLYTIVALVLVLLFVLLLALEV
jgi:hypothetical protein